VENEHWVYAVAAISSLGPVAIQYTDKTRQYDSSEFVDAMETNVLKTAREMFGDEPFTVAMVRTVLVRPISSTLPTRVCCF
jgi:hypothetical protein